MTVTEFSKKSNVKQSTYPVILKKGEIKHEKTN